MARSSPRNFRTVLAAGVAGAVLIALYLAVPKAGWVKTPSLKVLFQWDASNALGASAFQGGWNAAGVGMLMHFAVSVGWAGLFVFAASRAPEVAKHPILAGLVFGALVFGVMTFVLVPLGAARPPARTTAGLVNNLIAHAVFFGLPVALVVSRGLSVQARG